MGCNQSKPTNKVQPDDPRNGKLEGTTEKGLSVYYLKNTFLQEAKEAGFDEKSLVYDLEDLSSNENGLIRRKGENLIDPNDGRLGASYVDCLSGQDNVGIANVMLSYSWGYSIGDIVDTLDDFCNSKGKDPKKTYVWICCLCINQHRVVEKSEKEDDGESDFDEFQKIFHDRVKGIGQIVAMMYPWDKPIYLKRVWCVFELFTASTEDCDIFIAMPPKERRKMAQALAVTDGYELLLDALGRTSIEDADASREVDKVKILDLVQKGPGFAALNNKVNELLRDWVKEGILLAVDAVEAETKDPSTDLDFGLLVGQLGVVLDRTDSYDISLILHQKTLNIFLKAYGETDHEVASAHHNVGRALFKTGDFEGALHHYRRVLAIDQEVAGEEHPDTATSIANVADILRAQEKPEEAEKEIKRALNIRQKILGCHADTARSHSQLGLLYHGKEMYDEALIEHKKALNIAMEMLGESHPETATIYHNTGGALFQKGDYSAAMTMFEKALVVYEYLLGPDHSKTQHTVAWIDICKDQMEEKVH